jgi:hypothetical protein
MQGVVFTAREAIGGQAHLNLLSFAYFLFFLLGPPFFGCPGPPNRHNAVIGFCPTLVDGEGFNDMAFFGKPKEAWFQTFLECPTAFLPTIRAIASFRRLIRRCSVLVLALDRGVADGPCGWRGGD